MVRRYIYGSPMTQRCSLSSHNLDGDHGYMGENGSLLPKKRGSILMATRSTSFHGDR